MKIYVVNMVTRKDIQNAGIRSYFIFLLYADGAQKKYFLKTLLKYDCVEKPVSSAASTTDNPDLNSPSALCIRM